MLLLKALSSPSPPSTMSDTEKNAASIDEKVEVAPDVGTTAVSYTPEEERALVRKLDWRIMPIACIMYLFACKLIPLTLATGLAR